MLKVGITGVISCGKSTVCHILEDLGAYVVSADHIVHTLLTPFSEPGQKVVQLIGQHIVDGDQLNRKKIAQWAFGDRKRLHQLEAIIHPAVRHEIEKQYQSITPSLQTSLFIVEIPLMFEAGFDNDFDTIVTVLSTRERCIERFRSSTGQSAQEYDIRMMHQYSQEEKKRRAHRTIDNTNSLQQLKAQVNTLYTTLTTGNEGEATTT